eukprot:446566_1
MNEPSGVMIKPTNPFCGASLTDFYQITMAYALWKNDRVNEPAVYDLFFRKCPFGGQYVVFAGLSEALALINTFHFTKSDVEFLRTTLPQCEEEFWSWLSQLDCSEIQVLAQEEGSVVFPHVPLMSIKGPMGVAQLLETTILNCINFPSLVATNAARFRRAVGVGKGIQLIEFGLRRAQGPDGALSASRWIHVGGFDSTSNVLAGKMFGIPLRGTHAHSYVQSFTSLDQLSIRTLDGCDLVQAACSYRSKLFVGTNEGELSAFCSYALAFPKSFFALIDTYDVLTSGAPNFICVALALDDLGYRAVGVRIDSGDLAYLSREVRSMLVNVSRNTCRPWISSMTIMASNDINEEVLYSLAEQDHSITAFGIGTHVVTCQAQPALGCVYKLVSCSNEARMKFSEDRSKCTIPEAKSAFRLFGKDGLAILDLLMVDGENPPVPGEPILCQAPYDSQKRVLVTPSRVVNLLKTVWNGSSDSRQIVIDLPSVDFLRSKVFHCVNLLRPDITRAVNPTPYKVSVSHNVMRCIQVLQDKEIPIKRLS